MEWNGGKCIRKQTFEIPVQKGKKKIREKSGKNRKKEEEVEAFSVITSSAARIKVISIDAFTTNDVNLRRKLFPSKIAYVERSLRRKHFTSKESYVKNSLCRKSLTLKLLLVENS